MLVHYPNPGTVIKWLTTNIPDLKPALSTWKTIQLWLQGNTKIFITFIQMIGIVPGLISVQWPESFTTYFLNIFSVMSFDIQGPFLLGCVVNTSSFYYCVQLFPLPSINPIIVHRVFVLLPAEVSEASSK